MKDATRRVVLALALLATGAAAYFAPASEPPLVLTKQKRSTGPPPLGEVTQLASSREEGSVEVLEVRPRVAAIGNRSEQVFATPAPAAASRPSSAASAPPDLVSPPEPPPIAFKVLGQYADDGRPGLFLEFRGENMLAHAGDSIGGIYRIEAIGDGKVTVRYLPLDRDQLVDFSEQIAK